MKTEIQNARSSRRSAGMHSMVKLVLAAVILVLVNFYAFKHYAHKDLSHSQYYTLSPKTVEVLHKLSSPLHVYTFVNVPGGAPEIDNLLREYQFAGGQNVVVEKIDPDYDVKRAIDLQKQLHFDGKDQLVILEYKDHSPRFVKLEELYDVNPMTGSVSGFKGEQQITAAILSLVEGKPAKVYFTEGHGEHSIHDEQSRTGFGNIATALKGDNVEPESFSLASKGEVPADADALVIAGPTIAFSALEADAIDHYLANNGKLYILLDPYRSSGLENVLKKYGISYDDDLVLARYGTEAGEATLPLALIAQGGFSSHPITAKLAQSGLQMLIQKVRSIEIPNQPAGQPPSKTQFLLQTGPESWGWITRSSSGSENISKLTYNKTLDLPGPLTIAAAYDGGTTTDPDTKATMPATRVVAVGCSTFLQADAENSVAVNFFTNGIDWMVKKDAVLDIAPKKPTDYGLTVNPVSFRTTFWITVVFLPLACLIVGIVTWFSRRK
jgi:ABC-type uncharacterized transport system involved in gliding motility auxiliary subunit